MPYIDQDRRRVYDPDINGLRHALHQLPSDELVGHLTYVIYALLVRLQRGNAKFAQRAMLEAAVRRAAAEYARRHIDPYEDGKILTSGDVV